jgi:predicted RNA binding protein YcfA (HicA-like mRNA interferase family)
MTQIRPDELLRALQRAGWFIAREGKGSMVVLGHPFQEGLVLVPMHRGGKTIPNGTLRNILHDASMTEDELQDLL